jgi:hypothetical protein
MKNLGSGFCHFVLLGFEIVANPFQLILRWFCKFVLINVTTLTLGLQPKQRGYKVVGQEEA